MNPLAQRIDDKVCLITGGNSGIGKATALGLTRLGGDVVIVCRNRSAGESARDELVKVSGSGKVELFEADLSSLESVHKLADAFRSRFDRLDVLINNAGEILTKRRVTVDGFERTFASNHLGHFLLTILLLDIIRFSAPARIINVTSEAHRAGKIHFDNLHLERDYGAFRAYSQSKLANVLFTYELARRLDGVGITVNCIHPGTVRTGFGHDDSGLLSIGIWLMSPFFISAKNAAKGLIRLATSTELNGKTGKYFSRMKESRSSSRSYDEETARRLWDLSFQLCGLPEWSVS